MTPYQTVDLRPLTPQEQRMLRSVFDEAADSAQLRLEGAVEDGCLADAQAELRGTRVREELFAKLGLAAVRAEG
jgi:hypothetical protein